MFIAFGVSLGTTLITVAIPLIERAVVDDVIVTDDRALWPLLALLVGLGAVNFVLSYIRRFVGGRFAFDVQHDLRTTIFERRATPRLRPPRPAPHRPDRVARELRPRAGPGAAELPPARDRQRRAARAVARRDARALAAAHAGRARDRPALLFVSLRLRRVDVPRAVGLAAARRRGRGRRRRGRQRRARGQGLRPGRPRAGQPHRRRPRGCTAHGCAPCGSRRGTSRRCRRSPPSVRSAVLALGGWLAIQGEISIGTFLAFSTYLVQLLAPVRMFAGMVAVAEQARAGTERIFELIDSNPLVTEHPDAEPLVRRGDGEIDVRPRQLRLPPLGAGAARLLAARRAGRDGRARRRVGIGEVDGEPAPPPLLRRAGRRDPHRRRRRARRHARLASATRSASCSRTRSSSPTPCAPTSRTGGPTRPTPRSSARHASPVRTSSSPSCPLGYDTVVGERGLTLSGGQRQRISIARAVLTDPRVLVLDDATSSVDARTEEQIHATLREIMVDRTTVLIAHRRSTLRLADRIVLVHDGQRRRERHPRGAARDVGARTARCSTAPATTSTTDERSTPPTTRPTVGPRSRRRSGTRDERGRGRHAPSSPPAAPAVARTGWAAAAAVPRGIGGGHRARADARAARRGRRAPARRRRPRRRRRRRGRGQRGLPAPRRSSAPTAARCSSASRSIVRRHAAHARRPVPRAAGPQRRACSSTRRARSGPRRRCSSRTTLIDWVVTWVYTRYTGRTAERLLFALRIRIFAHLQRLALDYYDREMSGRIMTRMTTDVDAFAQLLQTGLITALVNVMSFVGVLVVLSLISWPLTLGVLVLVPPLVIATVWFGRRSAQAYAHARETISTVNAEFQESISGVRESQAYVREDRNIDSFRTTATRYLDARIRTQVLQAIYFPFILFLATCGDAIVLGLGSALVHDGTIAAGTVIAFLLYLDQFFAPMQQLSQVFDQWQQAVASMTKINELMLTPITTPDAVDTGRTRRADAAAIALRRRALLVPGDRPRDPARHRPRGGRGRDRGPRRRDRRGQVDAGEAGGALLRRRSRRGADRRHAGHRPRPARLPPAARVRAPGAVPVLGHHPRQHRVRPSRRDRRRGRAGRARGRRARLRRRSDAAGTSTRSPNAVGHCRPASASSSAWHARCSSTPRSSCSTKRPPTST